MQKMFQMVSFHAAKAAGMFCMILALLWLNPHSGSANSLSAAQVQANPEILHQRIKVKNPGYKGQAVFAQDQELGLIGDFNGDRITDLSALKGIPFGGLDLRGQQVTDLRPLSGMQLKLLGIEDTRVSDLSPLKGMKLEKLYLNNTPVSDLTPLSGMPLKELMLVGTKAKDLRPLKGCPLQSLWLNSTPVYDISPLAASPLVSLTLEGTRVSDLKSLARVTSLKRLHIGQTYVTDVTPLRSLRLERLIFSPENISQGLDTLRNMKSLTEVGTTLETRMPPEQFWIRYDRTKGN